MTGRISILVGKILDKLGVSCDDFAKKAHGKTTGITYGELLERILAARNCSAFSVFPEIHGNTFNCMMHRIFPDVKLKGGGQTWFYYLIHSVEHKYCPQCDLILEYKHFHKDPSSPSGRKNICRTCMSIRNTGQYSRYKELHKKSYAKNRKKIRARNTSSRIERQFRVPAWADLKKIEEFYLACPEGYYVDHIIPLRGKLVSGLHVLENLQYLLAEDNLRKSNKYELE